MIFIHDNCSRTVCSALCLITGFWVCFFFVLLFVFVYCTMMTRFISCCLVTAFLMYNPCVCVFYFIFHPKTGHESPEWEQRYSSIH